MKNTGRWAATATILLLFGCGSATQSTTTRAVKPCQQLLGSLASVQQTANIGIHGSLSPQQSAKRLTVDVFDSLGVAHALLFTLTPASIDRLRAANAAYGWNWTVSENGLPVADSSQSAYAPLFMNGQGFLLNARIDRLSLSSTRGAAAFTMNLRFNVTAATGALAASLTSVQDGFPVGTLIAVRRSPEGQVEFAFTSGQIKTASEDSCSL